MTQWPKQCDVPDFFGDIGANLVRMELPYPMRLAWKKDVVVRSTMVHEKVADSAHRVLSATKDFYGDRIPELGLDLFGGCYNPRKMTNGNAWSMHAWGIAFDFDPERNLYKYGRDRATLARPEYHVWWKLWEDEGWVSLGRARNFDWMHVQAARL
jgi:hypothetical protein